MKPLPTIALLVCCLVTGCATTPDTTAPAQARTERQYRTGSNIPVRDPGAASETKTVDRDTWEREHSMTAPTSSPMR